MKRRIFATVTVVLSVVILAFIITTLLSPKKESLFIGENSAKFRMTKTELFVSKGKAKEVNNDIVDTPSDEWVYDEIIEGYEARCSYIFWSSRLCQADITFKDIDYSEALVLCKDFLEKQEQYYSKYKGFSKEEISEDKGYSFETGWSVNFGATGIICKFKYSSGTLEIYMVNQE